MPTMPISCFRPSWTTVTATATSLLVALTLGLFTPPAPSSAQELNPEFPVTDGTVWAMTVLDSTLFIGGSFTYVGRNTGGFVGVDSASGEVAAGSVRVDGHVYASAPDGQGGHYLGGSFRSISGVPRDRLAHVRSDGTLGDWNPGADGNVRALAVTGSTVYVGGSFTTIGGQQRNRIAALDATTGLATSWNPGANGTVNTVAASGPTLYVGGAFSNAAGVTRNNLAAIDVVTGAATIWNPGANQPVSVLAVRGPTVYAGGAFTSIGGQSRDRVAALNTVGGQARSWNPGASGLVAALGFRGSLVYVGGSFYNIGSQARQSLAEIDSVSGLATSWNPAIESGSLPGVVGAILVSEASVYVGGAFTSAGGQGRLNVAEIDAATGLATSWSPHTSGQVNTISWSGSTVYVGGIFTSIGGVKRNRLAAIDITTGFTTGWDPGANYNVMALEGKGSTIYVGGYFTGIASESRSNIAALDASTGLATNWSPEASGPVYTIALRGSTVYVGGDFTSIGGQSRNRIAAIDSATGLPTSWDPGANGDVRTIAMGDSTVYAGGFFTSIGGEPRSRIAELDATTGLATSWNPAAGGEWFTVQTLALSGPTVYVGGIFTSMGGQPRSNLAAIDATTGLANNWNPQADGMVYVLKVAGPTVYSGGSFSTIGGQQRNGLAALVGTTGLATSWSADADSFVSILAVTDDAVYAGGSFNSIDGRSRPNLAQFLGPTPIPVPRAVVSDIQIAEGDVGAAQLLFTVTLSEPFDQPVTVDFSTVDGSATAADDYVAISGTLTIPPHEPSGVISVSVVGDGVYEPDETLLLSLSNPTNAEIGDFQAVGTIINDDPIPTIAAVAPVETLSPTTPSLAIPVTIARGDPSVILGYSVRLHLTDLTITGGGIAGFVEGTFLQAGNPLTSFQVVDNGGGSYTVDNVTLGMPCGSTATTGTLFSVAVGNGTLAGFGSVTIDQATVYDCNNAASSFAIGPPVAVSIDYTPPVVAVTSPNGGEFWPETITWNATDDVAIAQCDLHYSTDDGTTFSNVIALDVPNSGTYAWSPPTTPNAQARVRVTAYDVNGNASSDASDASFVLGQYGLTVSVSNGTVVKSPDLPAYDPGVDVMLTATAVAGFHFVEWTGDATGSANPVTITMDGNKAVTAIIQANPPVAPITALSATQVRTGNDSDGSTKIRLSWPSVPAGTVVVVYRAGFGYYPRYDELGGAVPSVPSYPPPTPWSPVAVSSSGETDEPPGRDFHYYVAFVVDGFGTVSPASNLTGGALNYHLGDVTNGATPGQGDNIVDIADVSLLGSHYGASGAEAIAFAYLDVGPTTDRSVHTRPTTDGRLDIEDLVLFGLNYAQVSAPMANARTTTIKAGVDELTLLVAELPPDQLEATLELRGTGAIQALATTLQWDPAVVEPVDHAAGELVVDQGGLALSPGPGRIDATLLGARPMGLSGVGEVASIRFRRLAPGDPAIEFQSAIARDALNQDVPLSTTYAAEVPHGPMAYALSPPFPNPFRLTTTLSFGLAHSGTVELAVFSVDGRRARTLLSGPIGAGDHRVPWDGRDALGSRVPAGIYYARLTTTHGQFLQRVVHLP